MYVCMHASMYAYVCIYAHTHTHTHTHARARARRIHTTYACIYIHTYTHTLSCKKHPLGMQQKLRVYWRDPDTCGAECSGKSAGMQHENYWCDLDSRGSERSGKSAEMLPENYSTMSCVAACVYKAMSCVAACVCTVRAVMLRSSYGATGLRSSYRATGLRSSYGATVLRGMTTRPTTVSPFQLCMMYDSGCICEKVGESTLHI
jgi:hypothetical protein